MTQVNQQEILQELQAVLETLAKQTLPVQTRGILQTARQRLAQLERAQAGDDQESRLAALYKVSQSLGISLNLDDVLNQVMDAVIVLTGAERGFLTLIDSTSGDLRLRAARNIERETLRHKDMEISRTVVQSVIESGAGVVTTDAQTDPRFAGQDSVVIYNLRSILCAPLRARGTIIGVIYVENRAQSGMFTRDDLDLLSTFATQAAVAIENARLYTRTDQALAARVAELETLSQIDQELNAELDLERVLETTRKWVRRNTQAQACWIALLDEEHGSFQVACSSADTDLPAPQAEILEALPDHDQPWSIPGQAAQPHYLAAPLQRAGQTVGGLVIGDPQAFKPDAAAALGRLAARAVAAIEKARLHQEVQQANESKSQFVALVTHELRIPLTSIKGYTDLIRQGAVGEVNEMQVNFLNVIRNNVERMATLISDLSDISRIERGKLKLEASFLDLGGYVEETIESLQHRLDEKQQTIETSLPADLPQVFADPNRVVQVLTNLVSNAWKYTPEAGQIWVRARQTNSGVRIEVQDTGYGISTADQGKLFTQFFRSESPQVREQTGWGLGLNVTKKLVELMNGEIGFESELGQGSTFWFSLPTSAPPEEA